jgi:hypothetical protein
MTISATHTQALVDYLTERGEQRYGAICSGMHHAYPFVRVTPYLLKKLWKEGRIRRIGIDTYCIAPPKTEGETAP